VNCLKKAIFGACIVSSLGFGVSMNFNGNVRTEASLYNKLNLGLGGSDNSKTFVTSRILVQPNLIIDDHFSVKSQWNMLASPNFTPNASQALGQGQGGFVFGDPNTQGLILNRVWLEWVSDVGILRAGRMPVSWGYGVLYDAGNQIWDDFQSTFDRLEYRLHLGNIAGGLAYSKGRKLSTLGNDNDQEFYTIYVQYNNDESETELGLLYEKQARSTNQTDAWTRTNHPYAMPGVAGAPSTSSHIGYPQSNHVLDFYLKKSSGSFSFGGEASWITGTAFDYQGDGRTDELSAYAVLLNLSYEFSVVKSFLDFTYVSGDSDLKNDSMTGFVLFHRNRRPGIILGRELLGPYYGSAISQGSLVYYGNPDVFSGVIYLRPGIRFEWSPSWSSGLEVIYAQKAAKAAGEEANLGIEIDAGVEHVVYKNFDIGATLGYLIPGKGLQVADPQGVFAFRAMASLKF